MCQQEVIVYHYSGCNHRPLQHRAVQRCKEVLWSDQPCGRFNYTKRTKFCSFACHLCRGVDITEEEAAWEMFLGPPERFWWSGTCPQSADLSPNPNQVQVSRNQLSPDQIQAQAQTQTQIQSQQQPNAEPQPMLQFHYNPTWHHN